MAGVHLPPNSNSAHSLNSEMILIGDIIILMPEPAAPSASPGVRQILNG